MDFGLKDRLALVTGASRGIGRAIANELACEGARVVLAARNGDGLEAARREMPAPDRHHAVPVDLMAPGGIEKLAESIGRLGNLDVIVHNLGGSAGVFQTFAPAADWQKVWQFNVGIAHELNCLLLPPMVQRRWGRIVHLSTLSATAYHGYAPYVSAKCALTGYIKSISREVCPHNVIVSGVAPGAVYIEGRHFAKLQAEAPAALKDYFDKHVPMRRLGRTEEVAATVAFLCSEQAAFMAGAIVAVDGGGF